MGLAIAACRGARQRGAVPPSTSTVRGSSGCSLTVLCK